MRPATNTFICNISELADGGARMFSFDTPENSFRLLVLRSGEHCYGYENRCPHFGLPLAARDSQLIVKPHESISCNTHYARFRWQDGYCEFGDCVGESLRTVALAIRNGQLFFA